MEGELGSDPTSIKNTFFVNGQEIAIISDPAHALKNMRNAWRNTKELLISDKHVEDYGLETNSVYWHVLEKVVEFQDSRELKIAPHLTAACLHLNVFTKMDVKLAMYVFSWETATAITTLCQEYPDEFPSHFLTTAFFIEMVARWWEIIHSRSRTMCFFTKGNDDAWRKNQDSLEKFMDLYSNMIISDSQVRSYWPSQKSVLLSSKSILWLAETFVKSEGFAFFLPGRCLNDCIENFFSVVRLMNKAPTALMFKRFAKAICVSQFLRYSPNGSYEEDDSIEFLSNLEDFKSVEKNLADEGDDIMVEFDKSEFDPQDFAEDATLAYFGGSLLKLLVKDKCERCEKMFIVHETESQKVNLLIKLRELKTGALVTPTEVANLMFKTAELTFRATRVDLLESNKNLEKKLVKIVMDELKKDIPSLQTCHLESIMSKFMRTRLKYWARFSNRLLQLDQQNDIASAANGSASMKQVQVTKNRKAKH